MGGKKKKSKASSVKLPSAPFKLQPAEIKTADNRAGEIVVPTDCSFRPRPISSKVSRLNSHDLKEVRKYL